MTAMFDRRLTTIHASQILACEYNRECSQVRVLRGIASGKIPAELVGGKWRISEETLPEIAKLFPPRKDQAAA